MKTSAWMLWLAPLLTGLAGPGGQDGEPEACDVEIAAGRNGTFPGYLPAGATRERPVPLVVACHGHGDSAGNFRACLKPFAAEAGVALLVPEGVEKVGENGFGWNGFPDRSRVIEGAIRTMIKTHPVDPRRILWLGHSAGTWVCCEDGAKLPDLCHGILLTAGPTATLAGGSKGPRPRVCLFLGTKDFNYKCWGDHLKALKAAKVAFTANRVTDLEHTAPDRAYLVGAVAWLLAGPGTEQEENTLPLSPPDPEERGCRHLLVRYKGAEGAGPEVKRSEKDARKEAERQAGLLRKEKPEKRAERAAKSSEAEGARDDQGALTAAAAEESGPLMRWTCWTLGPGEVRLVRSPAGFHAVWADR